MMYLIQAQRYKKKEIEMLVFILNYFICKMINILVSLEFAVSGDPPENWRIFTVVEICGRQPAPQAIRLKSRRNRQLSPCLEPPFPVESVGESSQQATGRISRADRSHAKRAVSIQTRPLHGNRHTPNLQ